ncbi:hypothetical protein M427DRAFT_260291 [Gonapodya prolifera JEL478]|uniref:Uncharacterized protein n=1 Tax=Gonapodya prolifera (strain JEL478) TaxID=1344416 RepID=A0A139AKS5_GONPJ|nr:hypothetical protein M427DRAFT_260291 [Gonapodya prolifera JEL478]|eukprot:KXS17377.1 hypothetical protein M427DRAFT_260291 [Gonapodya prolifera JEL478]
MFLTFAASSLKLLPASEDHQIGDSPGQDLIENIDFTEVGAVERIRAVQVISKDRPGDDTKHILAELYGVSISMINAWITLPDLPSPDKKLSANINTKRTTAQDLCAKGISAKLVSKAYAVTEKTVYNWLKPPPLKPREEWGKRGQKPKLTKELQREVFDWMVGDTQQRQFDAVQMVQERHGIVITQQTVSNILKRFRHVEVDPARLASVTHLNFSIPGAI